jgi:hypothetical protein
MVVDDRVREEIAFIRNAIEQGRGCAGQHSLDLLIWGIALAVGYLGTYAVAGGWRRFDPNWVWAICIGLAWLYSLRGLFRQRSFGSLQLESRPPVVQALQMLWVACGIFLSIFSIAVTLGGDMRMGWFSAVAAGTFGIAFFVSSYLCGLAWLRMVAVAWWGAALVLYVLRTRLEVLPVSAAFMLVLLALPGFLLWRSRPAA